MADPDIELTPIDHLTSFNGSFFCPPHTCHHYSSINFILAQYALAANSGAKTWKDYDEMSVFPDSLRSQFNRTMFINEGKCSKYGKDGLVHTYMNQRKNSWPGTEIYYKDFDNLTCANGWGFGNIAISASDAARFWYEYLGTENIINDDTKKDLMADFFTPIRHFMSFYSYGGGVMWNQYPLNDGEDDSNWKLNTFIGHGGMDYAS
jgi:CubicO group peptidase (beta-lactamase class C family)